jgi:hypothetical protein
MASPNPDKVSVDQARALVDATTFDIFNEHVQSKRRQLMEKYWATDVTCYSPFGASTGYDALDKVWDGEYFVFLVVRLMQPHLLLFYYLYVIYPLCALFNIWMIAITD